MYQRLADREASFELSFFSLCVIKDEFDEFYEVWELYDVQARGFIELYNVEEFVERIGPPLGIPRPNRIKLACLTIPICTQDRVFCMDLLDSLTRNFLGRLTTENPGLLVANAGQPASESSGGSSSKDRALDRANFASKAAKEPIVPVSSTYERQRQRMMAYKILYFWRKHRPVGR